MFTNYVNGKHILGVKEQHNIMVFVGNGFDITVLNKYRSDNLVTSYGKFYDYLEYKGIDSNNVLYKKMKDDKKNGKDNWSDFEVTIGNLIEEGLVIEELNCSLKEIQKKFLLFLNDLAEPEVLLKENQDAENNKWAIKSLSSFLSDIGEEDYKKMLFPKTTQHYHMFNFLFVNFNYTSLLDNYLYLDKEQFEPHPHNNVDTNFSFYPNPNRYQENKKYQETVWSSFIMTNMIHPHGYQNVPRSLLFGIEEKKYLSHKEYNKFNKSYWAQDKQKYYEYFDDAQLFIIYGTSIGITDSWWWERILNSMLSTDSELIIYYYNDKNYDEGFVKDNFINSCKVAKLDDDKILKIKNKIYVVLYNDTNEKRMFSLKVEDGQ